MGIFNFRAERKTLEISAELQRRIDNWPDDYLPVEDPVQFESFTRPYSQLFRTQPHVRAVVRFYSDNLSQPRLCLYKEDEYSQEKQPDHPVQKLLDHPSPGTSRSRFMRQVVGDIATYDHSFIWKQRDGGEVASLVRIPMAKVTIKEGNVLNPRLFTMSGNVQDKEIPAEDVIWLHGYSPTSNSSGVSPLESLRQVLAEMEAQDKDRRNFWRRGARGTLFFKQDMAARLDKDTRKRFIEKLRQEHTGDGANTRGIGILPPGVEPVTVGTNAEDSQLLASRQLSAETVCLAFGLTPEILGVRPGNYASIDARMQQVWTDTLAPIMVQLQEEFEEQLLFAEFEDMDSGFHLEMNIDSKLFGTPLERLQLGTQVTGGPTFTTNEYRKINNQPLMEGPNGEAVDDPKNPYNMLASPLNTVRGAPDNEDAQPSPQDSQNQFTNPENAPPVVGKAYVDIVPRLTEMKSPPWHVEKRGERWACIVDETGAVLDTHPTKAEADAHVAALYANVPDVNSFPMVVPVSTNTATNGNSNFTYSVTNGNGTTTLAQPEVKAFSDATFKASEAQHAAALQFYFERMRRSVVPKVKANADFKIDQDRWTDELYDDIRHLATATTSAAGNEAARRWAGRFQPKYLVHYLDAATAAVAAGVVVSVVEQLKEAQSLDLAFDSILAERVPQIAYDRAHNLTITGGEEAAKQVGKSRKTWIVNSAKSRHPERNGTTVAINSDFPWGAGFEPGCQCTVSFD